MEIFVKIIAENLKTGERYLAATSFLTFVALGADGKTVEVPLVEPETEEQKESTRVLRQGALLVKFV